MLDKEVKKNPALLAMIGSTEDKKEPKQKVQSTTTTKRRYDSAYKRNRGAGGTKAMSYYLPQNIIKAINMRSASVGITKSEVVLAALQTYLKDDLKGVK